MPEYVQEELLELAHADGETDAYLIIYSIEGLSGDLESLLTELDHTEYNALGDGMYEVETRSTEVSQIIESEYVSSVSLDRPLYLQEDEDFEDLLPAM